MYAYKGCATSTRENQEMIHEALRWGGAIGMFALVFMVLAKFFAVPKHSGAPTSEAPVDPEFKPKR